jgi:hypothetical protein
MSIIGNNIYISKLQNIPNFQNHHTITSGYLTKCISESNKSTYFKLINAFLLALVQTYLVHMFMHVWQPIEYLVDNCTKTK